MNTQNYPKIIFPKGFNQRTAYEMPFKGHTKAHVEMENGRLYSVFFYDPVRLNQDLIEETENDRPYLAEPGLIVLPEVTVERIEEVVKCLFKKGFFDYLKPE